MTLTGGHLDAMLAAGATAEQIVALVKADLAERDCVAERRRERDRERQRNHRSRNVTVTPRDERAPPKEYISNPPASEANASGGEPPANPLKEMFDFGLLLLCSTGTPEKQARSLLGKWRKSKGEVEVLTGLVECRNRSISNPVEWLEARFKSAKYVSKSGYEYRGTVEQVVREAERRNDMDIYWRAKGDLQRQAA